MATSCPEINDPMDWTSALGPISIIPAEPFRLRGLAPELRMMVFNSILSDECADGKTPKLLVALRGEQDLYSEALEVYRRLFVFTVSYENQDSMQKMSEKAFQGIRKLKLGKDSFYSIPDNNPDHPDEYENIWSVAEDKLPFKISFTRKYLSTSIGKTLRWAKNVHEVHYDISAFLYSEKKSIKTAMRVCIESFPKLKRIIFTQIMDGACHCYPDRGLHAARTHALDKHLGSEAKLWTVGTTYYAQWFWEAPPGKTFEWNEDGVSRG